MTMPSQNWALPTGPFRAGDRVQLTGPKGRLATVTLTPGARYGTHRGDVLHDDIIGQPEGSVIVNQQGIEYLAFRPLLSDFVLSMPRGAAIIYPKDAQAILGMADIYPGARVIEAGVGGAPGQFTRHDAVDDTIEVRGDLGVGERMHQSSTGIGDGCGSQVPSGLMVSTSQLSGRLGSMWFSHMIFPGLPTASRCDSAWAGVRWR